MSDPQTEQFRETLTGFMYEVKADLKYIKEDTGEMKEHLRELNHRTSKVEVNHAAIEERTHTLTKFVYGAITAAVAAIIGVIFKR